MNARSKMPATLAAGFLVATLASTTAGCSDDPETGDGDGGAGASSASAGGEANAGAAGTGATGGGAGASAGCLSCGEMLESGVLAVDELCEDQVSLWAVVNDCACDGCFAACNCYQGQVQSIGDPCGACLLSPSCSAQSDACEAGR